MRVSARYAEETGIDSMWATDHVVAAAVTERIGIGFNVMVLALRPVSWAALHISALQYVSRDLLTLGVGTGNPAHGDVGWPAAEVSWSGVAVDVCAVIPAVHPGTEPPGCRRVPQWPTAWLAHAGEDGA
jgi:alkanesulfonate monooxygenase SsuD/methylene tetrahydromethanopterin reductase-like flavin-dependent oxidoreductase (luciferase family)